MLSVDCETARPLALACLLLPALSAGISGQTSSLTLSSASTVPGTTVMLNLALGAAIPDPPVALQWTIAYPPGDIASLTVSPGPILASAGKTLSCAPGLGAVTCVALGYNTNPLASGALASVSVRISNNPSTTRLALPVGNAVEATAAGQSRTPTQSVGIVDVTSADVPVSLSVAPTNVTLTGGQTQQFVATVVDPLNKGVTWGVASGPGTITATGLYTAPPRIESVQTAQIVCVTNNGWKPATATVSLVPGDSVRVSRLSLTPSTVTGGSAVTGTVQLTGAAGAAIVVSLSSSNPSAAPVPPSVTVPAGSSSAVFTFGTKGVGTVASAVISASLAGAAVSSPLTITPPASEPAILTAYLSTTSISRGDSAAVVFQLAMPAWGGASVPVVSSNPAIATVPSSVTVLDGMVIGVGIVRTTSTGPDGRVTITVGSGPSAKSLVLAVE